MKTVKLICSDEQCGQLHGCLQFMRWGNDFHYCGICLEKQLCLLKHEEVIAEINKTFRCIKCINAKTHVSRTDEECSEAWKKVVERYTPARATATLKETGKI